METGNETVLRFGTEVFSTEHEVRREREGRRREKGREGKMKQRERREMVVAEKALGSS